MPSMPAPDPSPAQFWEARYADAGQLWSGKTNQALINVATDLVPSSALELGCGEGGDALWLAGHGWKVTGVDISPTAVRRATDAARDAGLSVDQVRFIAADLSTWQPNGDYDLITASFLQSPVDFPRTEVLRRAAGHVTPGGHLLVIAHAAFPPWAKGHDRHGGNPGRPDFRFLSPKEEIDALDLDPGEWDTRIAETRDREVTAPDGTPAQLTDSVVLLQRVTSP